ncbi:hydantoinase/oxoprolinase N-terminal domain-containing protein [Paracoccus sp. (in: a-proteobacteria)]|uniref:hydantoinase/oxoprolinase N-terminal domain-containing protein n=1 Tax=Paracoccus sp. TaxID=267 RepID=UPI003A850026
MKRIGIDVGGTNTDAVLIDDSGVLASVKVPTSADVMGGVVAALNAVAPADRSGIGAVMIGTTHFTNAVIERSRLERMAVIRIAMPSTASLPPGCDWPQDLLRVVDPMIFMVEGGHDFDGRPLVPLDQAAIRDAAARIRDAGIRSVAIVGLFSPLTAECEDAAAAIVGDVIPDARITLSGRLGRIGLLERENVAMLNAALQSCGRMTVDAFKAALADTGIAAPFYLTQNDGTVVLADIAAANPVYSFASGPTNSMRGAAWLTGLTNAMVADVGGTTTDIGCLVDGFPREANSVVSVGGVRTLFRMPDLLPIGLGGGTIIDAATGAIGPQSVGYRITQEARVFGGTTLTATDIAVAAGRAAIGDKDRLRGLDAAQVADFSARIAAMIEDNIDRMKLSAGDTDLIAVGGGAFLIPERIRGVGRIHRVEHAGVANAIGAAMAQISGEVDQVFADKGRDTAIAEAEALAISRCVQAGADVATVKVIEIEDLPLAYLKGDARRVRVRVVGDIDRKGA